MTADFNKLPIIEDLIGAGMPFAEATSFLDYVTERKWDIPRVWTYLLLKQTSGFPKLSQNQLSAHLKSVYGDKTPAEMGR